MEDKERRLRSLLPSPPRHSHLPLFLAFSLPSGRGILASLAKIRMRLVLLTVGGRGLARGFKRRRRRRALRTGVEEGARDDRERKTTYIDKKRRRWRKGRRKKKKKEEEEDEEEEEEGDTGGGSENYSQGISLEHPPRRRAGEREESGPAFPPPFSLPLPFYLSRQLLFLFSR